MGNYNIKSYNTDKSVIKISKKSNKRKTMNKPSSSFFQQLSCNKIYKRRDKNKLDLKKSMSCSIPSDNCEVNINRYSLGHYDSLIESFCDKTTPVIETNQSFPDINKSSDKRKDNDSEVISDGCLSNGGTETLCADIKCDSQIISGERPNNLSTRSDRFSESSLNSDDLMLSTDVNIDQVDDDVSKDYSGNEKDDIFIESLKEASKKVEDEENVPNCVEDSERNDTVYFDSSRESSVSLQRKLSYRPICRRPHSFSTPLRTDSKSKVKRSSNLSTIDSIDLAWTWMSASESANITQEISNLKLMLLKTRRLLLDDFNNDQLNNMNNLNEDDTNVFSEPNTPIYYNDQNKISNSESNSQQSKDWDNMDKEDLIQELQEIYERNRSLQSQLNDKNRVIELLQDGKRRFQRPQARTEPFVSRIARSSTFDTSTLNKPLSPTQEYSNIQMTLSKTGQIVKSDSRNIDSGLYQSSSSTDSYLYQNL